MGDSSGAAPCARAGHCAEGKELSSGAALFHPPHAHAHPSTSRGCEQPPDATTQLHPMSCEPPLRTHSRALRLPFQAPDLTTCTDLPSVAPSGSDLPSDSGGDPLPASAAATTCTSLSSGLLGSGMKRPRRLFESDVKPPAPAGMGSACSKGWLSVACRRAGMGEGGEGVGGQMSESVLGSPCSIEGPRTWKRRLTMGSHEQHEQRKSGRCVRVRLGG